MRLPRAREPSRSSVGDHKRMENRGRMPVVSARRFGRSLGGEAFRSGRARPAPFARYPQAEQFRPTLRWGETDSNCRSPVEKEVNPFRDREASWRRQKSASKR